MSQIVFLRMNGRFGRVRGHESNPLYDEGFVSPEKGRHFEEW